MAYLSRVRDVGREVGHAGYRLNAVEGEVYDLAYLGDMTIYHVRLPNGQVVKASSLNASRATENALTWNDRAWVSFAPDAGVVLTK